MAHGKSVFKLTMELQELSPNSKKLERYSEEIVDICRESFYSSPYKRTKSGHLRKLGLFTDLRKPFCDSDGYEMINLNIFENETNDAYQVKKDPKRLYKNAQNKLLNIQKIIYKKLPEGKKLNLRKFKKNLRPMIKLGKKLIDQNSNPLVQPQILRGMNLSYGASKIREWLIGKKINFVLEKTFPDCKIKKLLRFDFFLPDLNLAIEYDGRQHFEKVSKFGGAEKLKETQLRDKIKNNYCKDNNIYLSRISFSVENKIDEIMEQIEASNYRFYGVEYQD